jgi:dTDP-4-dehydrorhamnose reductase
MKILVFGSEGQVGSELSSALKNESQFMKNQPQITLSNRTTLNLTNVLSISSFLNRVKPDIVVNASAYTAVDKAESQRDLAFLINDAAVREMAIYCKRNKCSLIHISTDYVFRGQGDRAYVETDPTGPQTVYGASKLAGENAIREHLEEHIILRTSWVFGLNGANFVKTMLRLIKNKKELAVVGDQLGAPTSARGVAGVVATIIKRILDSSGKSSHWGTYHFCGDPYVSWADFAAEIFDQAIDKDLVQTTPTVTPIRTEDYPAPASRPANSRLDCSKLRNVFGIERDDWRRALGVMLDELKMRNPE